MSLVNRTWVCGTCGEVVEVAPWMDTPEMLLRCSLCCDPKPVWHEVTAGDVVMEKEEPDEGLTVERYLVRRCGKCGELSWGGVMNDQWGGTNYAHGTICARCGIWPELVGELVPGEVLMEHECVDIRTNGKEEIFG